MEEDFQPNEEHLLLACKAFDEAVDKIVEAQVDPHVASAALGEVAAYIFHHCDSEVFDLWVEAVREARDAMLNHTGCSLHEKAH